MLIFIGVNRSVPEALQELELLRGVPPNIQLSCEPWDNLNHADIDCVCLSSDRTGTYVHKLTVASSSPDSSFIPLQPQTVAPVDMSDIPEGLAPDGLAPADPAQEGLGPEGPSIGRDLPTWTRRPGSVPFVSNQAGVYGRLLLTTYVRWQAGLLTTCDWLRPVTREAGVQLGQSLQRYWLTSAD